MLEIKEFTRSGGTAHHLSLVNALTPLLASANAGSFHLRQGGGKVIIQQASFSGVDLAAVQAAVDAAPVQDADTEANDQMSDRRLRALAKATFELVSQNLTETQYRNRIRFHYKQLG